ncbi:MAG: NADH-quinone oxidoreductase subunit NuoE [Clostridia bacterium]|nr:NADH-quinone oxidoreductase subunit NuoE [Clostridia bacterium]
MEEQLHAAVAAILRQYDHRRGNLLPVLQAVQARLGYLPPEAMEQIASAFGVPPVDVYSVATFYAQFRLKPPGRHQFKVCLGTACHLMGGHTVLDCFERRLGIKEGETTPDREFGLERVACVGCCALAPVVVVDGRVEGRVSPTRVDGLLLSFSLEKSRRETPATPTNGGGGSPYGA